MLPDSFKWVEPFKASQKARARIERLWFKVFENMLELDKQGETQSRPPLTSKILNPKLT